MLFMFCVINVIIMPFYLHNIIEVLQTYFIFSHISDDLLEINYLSIQYDRTIIMNSSFEHMKF